MMKTPSGCLEISARAEQAPPLPLALAHASASGILFLSILFRSFFGSFQIDAFGKLGQLLVGLTLFVKSLLQQLGGFFITQKPRIRADTAIAGHLVMFHFLSCRDETRIKNLGTGIFFQEFLAF